MIELDLERTQGNFSLRAQCIMTEQVIGLFGPSGAGKSTLLAMIAGLTKPDTGYLIVDGEWLFDSKRGINVPLHKRHIGMVFQDSRLFPHLNVHENLSYGFNLLAPKDRVLGFQQIIEMLEIGHLMVQKPHQLSGGEKQRVALGRALLMSPRLLLLDEPLASLDVRLKHQILPFLRRVKDEINIPMIYVSHAIEEILTLTSHIAMIDDGKILAVGPFEEVLHDARVLAIAYSLGLENVINAQVAAHYPQDGYTSVTVDTQTLSIPNISVPVGSTVAVSITASNIALAKQKIVGVTIQNQLLGKVINIKSLEKSVLVTLDVGCLLIAEVTAKAIVDMKIELGAKFYCLIKTQSIRLIKF
ncbi:MAG: molybdenum ABC transporter ATP-binding protein [Bacteroidia bacterium]|nr:molybdenum ABC transporter ATP-binding protein [Methylotenera sp.]